MNAKLFKKFLEDKNACADGKVWAEGKSLSQTWKMLDNVSWLFWLIDKLGLTVTKKTWVEIAVYSAELVLPVFEDKFPADDRPRAAIAAAKKWIDRPSAARAASAASAARAASAASVASAASAAESAESVGIKICEYVRSKIKLDDLGLDG